MGNKTILVVDDDEVVRQVVAATLGGRDLRLLEAENGREAIEITRASPPDLVLLDIVMPEVDGLEVCRWLKGNPSTAHTKVVMLTGVASPDGVSRALEAGADSYFTKPFSPVALLSFLQQAGLFSPAEGAEEGKMDGTEAPPPAHLLSPPPLTPRADVRSLNLQPVDPGDSDSGLSSAQLLSYARDLQTLHAAARDRAAQFRRLAEIGKDLSGASSLDDLLRLALERVVAFSGCDGGTVMLLAGPEDLHLVPQASLGAGPDPGDHPLREARARQALLEDRPILPVQGSAPSDSPGQSGGSSTADSCLYLPLLPAGGNPVGALILGWAGQAPGTDPQELDLLQMLAGQLASLIQSRQLSERLQGSLSVVLAVHEAGRILSSTLERDEIGRHVLDVVQRTSGLEAALISLRNERQQLRLWQVTGPRWLWNWAYSAPAAKAARRSTLLEGDPRFYNLHRRVPPAFELGAWCLPLRTLDRTIGTLEIYGQESTARAAPVDVLATLANQAAGALETARLYRELADRELRLHEAIGQLLMAHEEERRQVAYEVHDGLAQVAASAHQQLQAYARHHRPRSPEAREALDRLLEAVQTVVGEARRAIANLHPAALDDFGLEAAIRQEVERMRSEGWQIELKMALGKGRLPQLMEAALFRVAQEALTNIRRHAQAERVKVAIWRRGQTLRLEVQDWGCGFRVGQSVGETGRWERLGILGMRERIALLGGRCVVRSRLGHGTRVLVEVPLPGEEG